MCGFVLWGAGTLLLCTSLKSQVLGPRHNFSIQNGKCMLDVVANSTYFWWTAFLFLGQEFSASYNNSGKMIHFCLH